VSAADCPGCGLPVATPADAGSWTPDGTVCWRGGRCEVSAADDADRALDRLRQIAAAWHRAVHVDSSLLPVHICDLDAVLAGAIAERTRTDAAETERDAARAEAAGLRARAREAAQVLIAEVGAPGPMDVGDAALRAAGRISALTIDRDSLRADNVRLRAAITAERAARAAWLATLPACATAPADVVAAEAATGAALDAAREGR
jgi:hypothetical protein